MDIIEEINRLKKEKNAVILSHYYVDDDVKEVDRKSTRLNSSHWNKSRMPSSA